MWDDLSKMLKEVTKQTETLQRTVLSQAAELRRMEYSMTATNIDWPKYANHRVHPEVGEWIEEMRSRLQSKIANTQRELAETRQEHAAVHNENCRLAAQNRPGIWEDNKNLRAEIDKLIEWMNEDCPSWFDNLRS